MSYSGAGAAEKRHESQTTFWWLGTAFSLLRSTALVELPQATGVGPA